LFYIAFIFLFMFIYNSFTLSIFSTPARLFWFCNLALLFIATSIFIKSPSMLLSFISLSFILQGIWISDILSLTFFNKNIFGTSYYLFLPQYGNIFEIFATAVHFFMIPLEIFAFILMKKLPKKFSKVIFSIFLFGLSILGVSLIFGPERNINYVYSIPFHLWFNISDNLIFFLSYLSFLTISSSLIGLVIYFIFKKYKKLFNLKYLKLYFWIILGFCFLLTIKVIFFILKTR